MAINGECNNNNHNFGDFDDDDEEDNDDGDEDKKDDVQERSNNHADGHDDVDDGDEDGQGSTNCGSCNPTLENMETTDKRLSICPTEVFLGSLLTCSPVLQRLKNQSYALGQHDPGSAQDWRLSCDFNRGHLCLFSNSYIRKISQSSWLD